MDNLISKIGGDVMAGMKNFFIPPQIQSPIPSAKYITPLPSAYNGMQQGQTAQSGIQQIGDTLGAAGNLIATHMPQPQTTIQQPTPPSALDQAMGAMMGGSTAYAQPGVDRAPMPTIPTQPPVTPAPTAGQGAFNLQTYPQTLQQGFLKYSGGQQLPVMQAIPAFVKAAQQYPFFQKHPYVLPSIALKESSGGKSGTPLMGYGVHIGSPNDYETQVLGAAHAIATMPAYAQYRQTGNVVDLLNHYAPSSENNLPLYAQQLGQFQSYFPNQ